MAIDIEKPAPLMIGDKAYYNLTSYDPVTIEVEVPSVTDFDVELAVASLVQEMGGTMTDLLRPDWVAEHFDGVANVAELREQVRGEITQMNIALTDEQKTMKCLEELAKRLRQSVPPAHVARAREGVKYAYEQQLAAEGLTMEQFCARTGMRPADVEQMYDQQALASCEQNAALDAYAREKKLTVSEEEFGPLLGIPVDQVDATIEQVRAAGQYEQMKDAALHAKAAQAVVAECSCTYRHETPEEARRRSRQLEELRRQLESGGMGPSGDQPKAGGNPAGLHLV